MVEKSSPRIRIAWLRKLGVPVLVIVVGVLVVLGLTLLKGRVEQPPPVQSPIVNVTVMELKPIERLEDTLALKGSVEPWAMMEVAAETAGRVSKINVREGDLIGRGQAIVHLEEDLLAAAHAEAKAKAEFDAREYHRMSAARGRQVATEMEVDLARSAAEGSKAAWDRAAAQLKRAVICAPEAVHETANGAEHVGRLNDLTVEIGEYVQAGHVVAQIVDTAAMKVIVDVPELDVRHLKEGQEVKVTIRALGDREITGTIHFISMVADPRTRTFRVEVKVANPEGDIRGGMVVKVQLLRRVLTDVLMIPLDAVIPLETDYEVFISRDGVAHRRTVSLRGSLIQGQSVEARPPETGEGLKPGDRLIIAGHRELGDGQRIRERPAVADSLENEPRPSRSNGGGNHAAQ